MQRVRDSIKVVFPLLGLQSRGSFLADATLLAQTDFSDDCRRRVKSNILLALFDAYDEDKTGTIDLVEIVPLLQEVGALFGIRFPPKLIKTKFRLLDADGSGSISKQEFLNGWESLGDEAEMMAADQQEGDHPVTFTQHLSNPFPPLLELLGLESSGTLIGDAATAVQGFSQPSLGKKIARYLFKKYDTNGSGQINKAESEELVGDIQSALDLPEEDFFSQIDTDNSGHISLDEFVEFFGQLCEAL